jgi:hypothetical protein
VHPNNIFQGIANAVIRERFPDRRFPKQLYHYTSADGLMGIVTNNTIRFSDAAYMNDGSEVEHEFEVLEDVIPIICMTKSPRIGA